MFGEEFRSVPIVQDMIDGSLSFKGNWALGEVMITSGTCSASVIRIYCTF